MICIYDIGNENFDTNGNAVMEPTKCQIKNVAGGSYELSMTHPIDAGGKWKHIVPGAIIKAPVPEEEIENAFAGYDADVYKTTDESALREGPSEPSTITYPTWSQYNTYSVGSKVTSGGKNYQCTYFDQNSTMRAQSPGASSWWKEIPRTTSGAAALVTLAAGTDLYFVEDYDSTWYKMSTYYGIVGYIKKADVVYDRHLSPSETKPRIITEQLFRMEQPTVDTKSRTVTVNAKHVSYDLNGILIKDVRISLAPPAMALGRIIEGFMMDYRGTIATNLTETENGTYTQDIKGKNGIYALLDPDAGIVSNFNAAYKRDNWDLFVMKKTVTDRGYRIKYRKNMLGVNWAQDSSGLVTRVVPVAKDEGGADLYLPELWVDSPRINQYPVVKMERLTVKGQVGKDKGTGDGSTWTESDLLDEMRTKAGERFSVDQADQISVTVTVDFEQQGDTEEYKALKQMEKVLLYDTVSVENEEIGLTVSLFVSEWEWDAIRKKTVSLKLIKTTDYKKGSVTGYNVQNKSISSNKLMDDVVDDIIDQVTDIIPEYADPDAARPASNVVANSKTEDGIITKGQGQASKVWATDAEGNPAWRDGGSVTGCIPISEKGAAGGVATLDNSGKVPETQLPSYVDDIIEGYLYNGHFYEESTHTTEIPGESGKIYVDLSTEKQYRWSGSVFSEVSKTSVTDNNPTLAWGQQATIGNVAGTDLHVVMPANPNTDHYAWSDITGKPDTATRWPSWNEVTGKPSTFYTLPLAANGTRGGVQIGYTQSGKNYPVQLDGEKMYVNVPWTDHYAWSDITGKPSTFAPSSGSGDYLRRDAWWNQGDSHDANDLHGGITFAYSNHANTPLSGTIVSFDSADSVNYGLQLQGSYNTNKLFYRNRYGDNGYWHGWKQIAVTDGTDASGTWGIDITGTAAYAWYLRTAEISVTTKEQFESQLVTIINGMPTNAYRMLYAMVANGVNGFMNANSGYEGIVFRNPSVNYGAAILYHHSSQPVYIKVSNGVCTWTKLVTTANAQNNLTSSSTEDYLTAAMGKSLYDGWTLKTINKTIHFTNGMVTVNFSGTVHLLAVNAVGTQYPLSFSRTANYTGYFIQMIGRTNTMDMNVDFYFMVNVRSDSGISVSAS